MHMKKLLVLLGFPVALSTGMAQNLVPNPSFENVVTAPCSWLTSASQLPAAVTNWTMPSDGSTDIFSDYVANTCYAHNFSINASAVGQQAPRTGRVQSALLTYGSGCGSMPNYREYLQVQLTSPLVSGQTYDFEFWVSMADNSNTATNNFGVHFRTSSYYQATCFVIPLTPQFNSTTIINNKTSWVRVNGTITATANWSHIVIGNFFSNAATSIQAVGGSAANSRYFIDDISVTPAIVLNSPELALEGVRQADGAVSLNWVKPEIAPEDGYFIQRSSNGDVWETIHESEASSVAHEDLFAPNMRLLYRLRYTDEEGNSMASETVTVLPLLDLPFRVVAAPNPSSSGQPTYFRISNADATEALIKVLDVNGRLVHETDWKPLTELDNYPLQPESLRPGVYVVQVMGRKNLLATTRWVVSR